MTSTINRAETIRASFLFVLILLWMTFGPAISAHAADIPAVSDPGTFGVIDGEFGLKGLKGHYRWNVIRKWTKGDNAVRADNSFGVVNGEFTVPAMYIATSTANELAFHEKATINGTTDEKGAIFYPPDQEASFSQQIMGDSIKYILMNNAYHVVGKGPRYEVDVVTRDGFLTCADGTEVSLFAIYAEEISNDPYSAKSGFKDLKLYEPGTVTAAYLLGSYQDGRIVLNPDQRATIQSTRKLRLEDGTILLPNEDGIYHVEVKNGIPTFVGVTVETQSQ